MPSLYKRVFGNGQATDLEQRDANGGPASGVVPPARSDLGPITPDVALSVGAVYRSVSILSTSVAQMELGVFRDGVEIRSPLFIREPSADESATGLVSETVYSLAAHGNAYWRIERKADGTVDTLRVLDPNSVSVTWNTAGTEKVYHVGQTRVPAKNIKHLRLFRKPGHLLGYGPIQHGQKDIEGALRLQRFAEGWYGTTPRGILRTDQVLNATQAQEFITAFKKFLNDNSNTAVFGQGMNYEHINIKPSEAQFLEVQQSSVVNIARLFGIPAMHLLAELTGTSNTYLNLEQAQLVFLQTTLAQYMNEIEEAFSSLLPRGQRVQFKEEGLLRLDTVTKWEVISKQVEIGYTSGNEMRKAEGKAPLPLPPVKAAPVRVVNEPNKDNEVKE